MVDGGIRNTADGGGAGDVRERLLGETTYLIAIEGMLLRHSGLLVTESRRTKRTLRTLHIRGQ